MCGVIFLVILVRVVYPITYLCNLGFICFELGIFPVSVCGTAVRDHQSVGLVPLCFSCIGASWYLIIFILMCNV